jgi:hypothetical protein
MVEIPLPLLKGSIFVYVVQDSIETNWMLNNHASIMMDK